MLLILLLNATETTYPFGAGTGNSKLINGTYWYPGDEWKDVARMVMYMCGTLWQSMPSTLLQ
jgi:hypothetical protein